MGHAGLLRPGTVVRAAHDTGTDIYSLGLVLHTCLTGRPVWPARTSDDVLIARACDPVPQLSRLDGLPDGIVRLHRACLTRSPRRRPSADHVMRSLTEEVRRHRRATVSR